VHRHGAAGEGAHGQDEASPRHGAAGQLLALRLSDHGIQHFNDQALLGTR